MTERKESEAIPRVLPRGRHGLDSSVVRASQRMRLVEAMTEECAENGYANTTVADVIERSGISRKTFYEHFKNKEDCFLEAYIDGHDKLRADIADRMSPATDWREALEFAIRGYLESLAARPAFTRIFANEALAAGGRVREERDRRFELFIGLYRELARRAREENPELEQPSDEIVVAAIGAIAELVRYTVAKHGPEYVANLYEPINTVAWTLVIGDVAGSAGHAD